MVCLAAAHGAVLRRVGWDVEANGLFGAPPIVPPRARIRDLGDDPPSWPACIVELVERHCALARHMARWLVAEPGVHVMNDVELNQVIERDAAECADRLTREAIARVQSDGSYLAGGTSWRERWVMRLSVIGFPMDEAEMDRSAEAILVAWRAVHGANETTA